MKPVTVSIEVPQPTEEVFDYLAVLANHGAFLDHFLVDWKFSGPPRGVGQGHPGVSFNRRQKRVLNSWLLRGESGEKGMLDSSLLHRQGGQKGMLNTRLLRGEARQKGMLDSSLLQGEGGQKGMLDARLLLRCHRS